MNQYIRPFPRVVRIEPCGACNLACSLCPTGTVELTRGVMKPATFEAVIRNLEANLEQVKVVVLYHGGEPLLNKRFTQMVRAVKALGIPFVKTVSNGMLLTDSIIAGLIDSGLDSIEFSLDGESPDQNNLIRRKCDFETVASNIRRLIQAKQDRGAALPSIYIATTQFVDPKNHRQDREAAPPAYLLDTFGGYEKAGAIAGFKASYAYEWPHMVVDPELYERYRDPFDLEYKDSCDLAENTITVRWNGDVVPCCYDLTSRYVTGNVLSEDLPSIWNGEKHLALRRSIAERKFVSLCANCNVVRPKVFLIPKSAVIVNNLRAAG